MLLSNTAGIHCVFVYFVTVVTIEEPKMAVTPGGEDSVYDVARLSLFDLILEKTRAQNKVIMWQISVYKSISFLVGYNYTTP